MKKKILALTLVICLAVVAVAGATLAYFTDTDKANNTFTIGNVKIDLIERQRNADGDKLVNFENDKMLLPIVGSAQGEKDAFGLPTAENYVDKIVTIKNLKLDAWVRLYYAIPTVLDNEGDASQNVVHVNTGNKFVAAGDKTDGQAINKDYKDYMGEVTTLATNVVIDGIAYNVYYMDYNKVLHEDEETGSAFLVGLYLDQKVDYDGTNYTINGQTINYDFTKGVNIPVFAVGVQASGFDTCAEAINAAFGANYNPWAN